MTQAEYLSLRGLRTVTLPSSGATVQIRKPKTRQLMQIGLFPLKIARTDMSKVDPDEKEHLLKEAERCAVKLICGCSVGPRFVTRNPRAGTDEVSIDTLDADDFAFLNEQILDFVGAEVPEPPVADDIHFADNLQALALVCEQFGLDPTVVEDWEQERVMKLFEYAKLANEARQKARGH